MWQCVCVWQCVFGPGMAVMIIHPPTQGMHRQWQRAVVSRGNCLSVALTVAVSVESAVAMAVAVAKTVVMAVCGSR
jgi:hypothetical protein